MLKKGAISVILAQIGWYDMKYNNKQNLSREEIEAIHTFCVGLVLLVVVTLALFFKI
jgi:hypothetical protein